MNRLAKTHLVAGTTICLALCAAICGCGAATPASSDVQRTITVQASSTVEVAPDVASITVAIVTPGKTAAEAQQANAKPTNAVVSCLTDAGIEKRNIQTSYTDVSPTWDDEGRENGYEMRTVLYVQGIGIDEVAGVMEDVTAAGATEVNGPDLYTSSYDESYQQALVQAIEASRPKAETIAQASGVTLGSVVSVTEGWQDGSIAYDKGVSTEAAMADELAIMPGELSVEATVTVSYAIR